MFYLVFISPQAKRCAIITYRHGIYELSNEWLNDLILRKLENMRNVADLDRMIA